eukprot:scaffold34653_cov254-Amphora_coffeaeformis.AAC.5
MRIGSRVKIVIQFLALDVLVGLVDGNVALKLLGQTFGLSRGSHGGCRGVHKTWLLRILWRSKEVFNVRDGGFGRHGDASSLK